MSARYVTSILLCFFFVKQKTAYEMRISDWSSDVCSSDLHFQPALHTRPRQPRIEPAPDLSKPLEPDDLGGLVKADQVAHPAEQRDVGDAVIVAHHPVATCQPFVEQDRKSTRLNSSH